MKLRYINHSQYGKLETTASAVRGLQRVQLTHRDTRATDLIDLQACYWVPLARILPLAMIAGITLAGIIAVAYLAAGLPGHAVPPVAMVGLLCWRFPGEVLKHGCLVSAHLVLVPETRQEEHIFAGCPTGFFRRLLARR